MTSVQTEALLFGLLAFVGYFISIVSVARCRLLLAGIGGAMVGWGLVHVVLMAGGWT